MTRSEVGWLPSGQPRNLPREVGARQSGIQVLNFTGGKNLFGDTVTQMLLVGRVKLALCMHDPVFQRLWIPERRVSGNLSVWPYRLGHMGHLQKTALRGPTGELPAVMRVESQHALGVPRMRFSRDMHSWLPVGSIARLFLRSVPRVRTPGTQEKALGAWMRTSAWVM